MPDYLGEDQRKTKQKDEKDEDKPIKGNFIDDFSGNQIRNDDVILLALDEAEIALLKSYVSSMIMNKISNQCLFRELVRMIKRLNKRKKMFKLYSNV